MELTVNVEVLAEVIGVTTRQVYNLIKQGMPVAGKGKYHLPTVVQWLITERSGENEKDINAQRKALYKAQTDKHELDNEQVRGNLISADVVQTTFFELGTRIRTQVESIEPRLARMLPPEVVIELRKEIKAALEGIADDVETFANSRDDSRDHPPPTGTQRGELGKREEDSTA